MMGTSIAPRFNNTYFCLPSFYNFLSVIVNSLCFVLSWIEPCRKFRAKLKLKEDWQEDSIMIADYACSKTLPNLVTENPINAVITNIVITYQNQNDFNRPLSQCWLIASSVSQMLLQFSSYSITFPFLVIFW